MEGSMAHLFRAYTMKEDGTLSRASTRKEDGALSRVSLKHYGWR